MGSFGRQDSAEETGTTFRAARSDSHPDADVLNVEETEFGGMCKELDGREPLMISSRPSLLCYAKVVR